MKSTTLHSIIKFFETIVMLVFGIFVIFLVFMAIPIIFHSSTNDASSIEKAITLMFQFWPVILILSIPVFHISKKLISIPIERLVAKESAIRRTEINALDIEFEKKMKDKYGI